MRVTKLDARSHRAMRWKNGGGTTLEVARSPEGESLEDFDWRVSLAQVTTSGPFSRFAGVDRSIAILEGDGVALSVHGLGTTRLDPTAAPLAFPGDVEASAMLVGGPILDLNVMTRRSRFRHALRRLDLSRSSGVAPVSLEGEVAFVVVGSGAATVRTGEATEHLATRDALRIDSGTRLEIVAAGDALVFCVELWRV